MARLLLASDLFNRADGKLGSNHLDMHPAWATANIVNQTLRAADTGAAQVSRWQGATIDDVPFTANQYFRVLLAPGCRSWQSDVFRLGGVLRPSGVDATRSCYAVYFANNADIGQGCLTRIVKVVNGAPETVLAATNVAWADGDTISGEVDDSGGSVAITAYRNDVPISGLTAVVDSSSPLTSSLPAGIYIQGNINNPVGDAWEAGNVVAGPANDPPTFPGPNIADKSLTDGVAMSPDTVSDSFSDTDALTFSAVGSWPAGITVTSVGVIQGTPTQLGTFANLRVRATDTASQTVDSNAFTIVVSAAGDTTPPALSSPGGAATGSTTATCTVTTDEGNGTLYVVVSTGATPPTAAQIRAGQDSTGAAAPYAGNQVVTSTGAKTFNASGLSASTAYYAHFHHRDAANNDSAVVSSASFTTGSGGVVGTITSSELKNNAGSLLQNETGATAHVYALSGELVATLTGETTGTDGRMLLSHAAITAGVTYRVVYVLASGAEGMELAVAA